MKNYKKLKQSKNIIANGSKKVEYSGIRKIFALAGNNPQAVDLTLGQPDFAVPSIIQKEAIASIQKGFNKYAPTQGLLELRQAIAIKLQKDNSICAKPEDIIVTAGATGALLLSFFCLINPGDEIIIFDPYFVAYKQLGLLFQAKIKFIPTYPDFRLNLKFLTKAISTKTKFIIVNSPNNPTGRVYTEQELRKIAQIAEKNNLLIISDEVYEKFIYDGKHFSLGSIYPNTLTINGFSKSVGLSGWRIGYAHGPKKIIDEMVKIQQFSFVCVPAFMQKAAVKALEIKNKFLQQYQQKRDYVYQSLQNDYQFDKPAGAFYFFIKSPTENSEKFLKAMMEKNLFFLPGNIFSIQDTHFRISYACRQKNLIKAVKILKSYQKKKAS